VLRRVLLLQTLWLLLPGCGTKGPAIGALRGQVRLDGKPLTACMVQFENGDAGVSLWAPVDAEGKYVARTHDTPGLPVGSYRVAVKPHQAWNVDPKTGLPALVAQGKKEPAPPIPARFFSGETRGLSVDVKEGENPPFDVELPSR
jgi:hypothetical protein